MSTLRHGLLLFFVFLLVAIPQLLCAQRIVAEFSNIAADAIAVNSATNKVYVVDFFTDSLVAMDGATNQVIGSAPLGRSARRPVVNSVTNKIYVPNGLDNTITIVDGATLAATTLTVGTGPSAAAVNTVTNKIYVANSDDNTVTIIDGATLSKTTVAVDEGPLAIAVNATTNKIYVGNQRFVGWSSVSVIDGATHQVTTFPLPYDSAHFAAGADSLIVNPNTNHIYVLGYAYLFDIDGATDSIVPIEWQDPGCILSMAVNPTTNHLYGPDTCTSGIVDVDLTTDVADFLNTSSGGATLISIDTLRNRLYLGSNYLGDGFLVFDPVSYASTQLPLVAVGSRNMVTNSLTNTTYFGSGRGFTVLAGASPMQFLPLPPCRVFDSRNAGGEFQGYLAVDVLSSNCNIPANAAAYSLNITLVPAGNPVGYLTVWPTDQYQPAISTMNSLDGRIKANAAIVSAGTVGLVSLYASNSTNVVIDIDGYFAPSSGSSLAFYPLPTPCRVIDTRDGTGDLNGPYLSGGHERDFPILESSCIPVGTSPRAYSFNVTAVPHRGSPLSYLTVWPQGQMKPLVSTLNNPTATIVANAAIVPAGEDGGVAVFPSNDTDLVVDINGYFAPAGPGGLSLYSSRPCRAFDTRQRDGAFTGELTVDIVHSGCLVPETAQAYVLNATVVPQEPLGYLTLYPDGQARPTISTLNATDGAITSNMAIVLNTDGSIDAYADALTQLVLDVSSYFAP